MAKFKPDMTVYIVFDTRIVTAILDKELAHGNYWLATEDIGIQSTFPVESLHTNKQDAVDFLRPILEKKLQQARITTEYITEALEKCHA